MPEDDYTGVSTGELSNEGLLEDGFYEVSLDDDDDEVFSDDEDELQLNLIDAVNGAKSLLEVASRLYDLADELSELSESGWEIVDDVLNGCATAVQFGDNSSE